MSDILISVETAATELKLHPKTVLRYIHDGRLPATRVGKSYRIARSRLAAFAGVATERQEVVARTTCIVDIPDLSPDEAQRTAAFLQSAALAAEGGRLHLETAFDPLARTFKLVIIGRPAVVGRLLEMLELQLQGR